MAEAVSMKGPAEMCYFVGRRGERILSFVVRFGWRSILVIIRVSTKNDGLLYHSFAINLTSLPP